MGFGERGTRYCWAWCKHNLKTNKWAMFLETETALPYCIWSIKMVRIIWFGTTSKWLALVRSSSFLNLCKVRKFLITRTYSSVSIKEKNICQKKCQHNLVQVWFASVLAPSSAVSCSPWKLRGGICDLGILGLKIRDLGIWEWGNWDLGLEGFMDLGMIYITSQIPKKSNCIISKNINLKKQY